jgi:hypothetical protein
MVVYGYSAATFIVRSTPLAILLMIYSVIGIVFSAMRPAHLAILIAPRTH